MIQKVRDFINRREPGARWMLLLLVVLLIGELVVLFTVHAPRGEAETRAYLIPPIATAIALLLQRWWSLPASPAFPDPKYEIPSTARRWVWVMAGAITLLAAWPRSARLNQGFSAREPFPPVTAPAEQRVQADKPWRLMHGTVAASVAKLTAPQSGGPLPAGIERKARTLPWMAGLLVAGMVVLVGASLGSPRAGMAAGLIVALHPAHVQWSSEISDFPLQQLGFLTALYCLLGALRTNAWRWWIPLGLLSNLFTAGHFSSVLTLLALMIAGAVASSRSAQAKQDRLSAGLRCFVVMSIGMSSMLIPGVLSWGLENATPLSHRWAILATGDSGGNALLVHYLLPVLSVCGVWFMLRQDWRTQLAGPVMVLGLLFADPREYPPVFMEATACLPLLLVWAGVGIARLFPRARYAAYAPLFVAMICVFIMSPRLHRMMGLAQDPTREAARAARGEHGDRAITVVSSRDARLARLYDPAVRTVASVEELKKLTDTAFDTDTPLLLYFSPAAVPAAIAREAATGGRFQLRAEFPAADPGQNVMLYEYHPVEQIIRLNIPKEK